MYNRILRVSISDRAKNSGVMKTCHYTIVDGGPGIMAKIFGVFGTKTCSFIKENRTKNGPLVFRTVLCSKHDEKLGN